MGLFIWKYNMASLSSHVLANGGKRRKKEGVMDSKCTLIMNPCFVPFSASVSSGQMAEQGDIPNVIGMFERNKK